MDLTVREQKELKEKKSYDYFWNYVEKTLKKYVEDGRITEYKFHIITGGIMIKYKHPNYSFVARGEIEKRTLDHMGIAREHFLGFANDVVMRLQRDYWNKVDSFLLSDSLTTE